MKPKYDKYFNSGCGILLPDIKSPCRMDYVQEKSIIPASYKYSVSYDKLFKPFTDGSVVMNADTVVFHRDAGLGDVLLAIPVVRQLKQHYNIKNVYYQNTKYIDAIKDLFTDITFVKETNFKYDFIFKLNTVLERDHELGSIYSYINRVQIYQDFLELPQTKELDWSFDDDNSNPMFDDGDNVIALQIRAMNVVRMYKQDFVKKIANLIVSMGYKCMIYDDESKYGWEGDGIINSCGKLTIGQLFGNIKRCKACVTYDSGTFWTTHFTKTPTLVILGSTRAEERLNYHPLYKTGKLSYIDMKGYVGCDNHCCGTGTQCNYKANCFNKFDQNTVLSDIKSGLAQILKNNGD